jgi:hypothetical protein
LTVGWKRRRFRGFHCLERSLLVALATLALGMVMFASFYGLVAACDRL